MAQISALDGKGFMSISAISGTHDKIREGPVLFPVYQD